MATNYERGRAFEYRTRKRLTEMGAEYIMRAASSKGAADLMVLWPKKEMLWAVQSLTATPVPKATIVFPHAWLVQCKMDGRLPKAERETLVEIAAKTSALPVLASKNKKGSLVFHEITLSGDGRAIIQVVP